MLLAAIFLGVLLLDMQNLVSHWRGALPLGDACSDDYTLVVPLYGNPGYFRNVPWLLPLRERVLLAIHTGTPQMARFAALAEAHGWRVHRCEGKPSPPELLQQALASVTTTWVIRIDGDTEFECDPGHAIEAAHAAGADLCSVKVLPRTRTTMVERLQGLEYDMAMLGRHCRPWLTSGACMIARTRSIRAILEHHTKWFIGEDIETGLIAKRMRMRIRHVDVRVFTEVPASPAELFRQRRGWWAGCFRLNLVNLDHCLREPVTLIYGLILIWGLYVAKVGSLVLDWRELPALCVLYAAVCAIANWRIRTRLMIVYPYYALVQAIVMPIFGVVYFARAAAEHRSVGRFRTRGERFRRLRRTASGSLQAGPTRGGTQAEPA